MRHVELEIEASRVAARRALLFRAPTHTRRRVRWAPELVRAVEQLASQHPDLAGYRVEAAGDGALP
ncbi:MAG TPA: hypothetical protein VFD92_10320 [Candidatus Binatia bacterium]|nr:hypothetical protein [Candidatus Binatia bacterium]